MTAVSTTTFMERERIVNNNVMSTNSNWEYYLVIPLRAILWENTISILLLQIRISTSEQLTNW